MTREIPLTRGMVARVDDADYGRVVAAGKWCAKPDKRTFYAIRTVYCPRCNIQMHSFITGWPMVDHVNGDGLDNRRENLRLATSSQNSMNRVLAVNNTSGFKGVTLHERRWQAQIRVGGRSFHLGTYDDREEAARAYDEAAHQYFGEFARPNFPDEAAQQEVLAEMAAEADDPPVAADHYVDYWADSDTGGRGYR